MGGAFGDFKSVLYSVAEIGYTAIEFAGYSNLSSKDMVALLTHTGLQAIGSHVSFAALEKDFDREINYCLNIVSSLLVVPSIEEKWRTGEGMKRLSDILNAYGRRAQERGIILAYHNHDFEFRPDAAGELIIDKLLAGTDPALMKRGLIWAVFAGIGPIGFMHKHRGRMVALHLKDMTPDRTFTEVSDGILDIAGCAKAARASGTGCFIVENDSPSIPSLESARRSFENIHRRLQWW